MRTALRRLLPLLVLPASAWGFNLSDALTAARAHDAQWQMAQAQWQEAQEKRPQARSALLPSAAVTANATRNDQETWYAAYGATQSGVFTTHQVGVNVKVPILGQQAWNALSEAEQQVDQARLSLDAADADLSQRLVHAYAAVVEAQLALIQAQALLDAYTAQLTQAQALFDHGQVNVVDIDVARAKHDQAAADLLAARNSLQVQNAALAEITDTLPGEAATLSPQYSPAPLNPDSLSEWQALALHNNSAYLAKERSVDVAQAEINTQKAAYLPTADLVGNYAKNGDGNAALMGQSGTVIRQWSLGIQVNVPLYSGGATNSAVRQAVAAKSAAQSDQEQLRRKLLSTVTQAYLQASTGAEALAARRQALQSAQIALQAAQMGLEHGRKTQLDVLQARQQLTVAQHDYNKTLLDTLVSEVDLKVTAGVMSDGEWERLNEYFPQNRQ